MTAWLGPDKVPTKSTDARLAEATEGGALMDDTVPTDKSKKNVNVSPGETASGTVLTQNTDRTALDAWPTANSVGLMLKATREPVWARAPGGNSNNKNKERLSTRSTIDLPHRIASPPSKADSSSNPI